MDKYGEKFYMVWREGGQRPRFKHTGLEAQGVARAEAQRVAEKHPGSKVYVMESIECYATIPAPSTAEQLLLRIPNHIPDELVPITKTEIEKELPL